MRLRPNIACFLAVSLLVACSEELATDENERDDQPTGERALDGGRDASRIDASADDDEELAPTRDAGRDAGSKRDAAVTDASQRDASPGVDASEPDASAPATDASAPATDASAPAQDAASADAGSAADCSGLTYESFGRAFLGSYCAAVCHSSLIGIAGVRLDTLEGVMTDKARAMAAVESRAMPPLPPGPSDDERARFVQWVECGAP